MTITYALIQMVGRLPSKLTRRGIITKARVTELIISDGTSSARSVVFGPVNHGMLSKCRFDGAEGTVERVLALRTMRCRVRDEGSHFHGGRTRRRTRH